MKYFVINKFYNVIMDGSRQAGYHSRENAESRCYELNLRLERKGLKGMGVVMSEENARKLNPAIGS